MTDHEPTLKRYAAPTLISFATQLLQRAGLPLERAAVVGEMLVEADLMGHSTHGLQLLAPYLQQIEGGSMTRQGDPETVADHGAALTWDGRYLPGPWLVVQAMNAAFERIHANPVVTIAIRRSHHIGCLAVYPRLATERGLFMLLVSSDPNEKSVAPYGGIRPLYTPNPLAAGIPTQGDPILIDTSMSATANGVVARHRLEGKRLPHPWLLDHAGNPSDDPDAMFSDPPGSVLPLGGTDLGYKGFALGLLIEAMTSALAGFGRSDRPQQWGASVFLQIIDPEAFGGRAHFLQETQWLAEAARSNPTRPGDPPVRLPGSRGLRLRAEQLRRGVALYPAILPALESWSAKLGVALPASLSDSGS
ncbi:MAG: Ldh family oxidoreductase [Anaerolineae bacterium]|nr:Ldh family oxidoreductase [Anaerolineae bacterium]